MHYLDLTSWPRRAAFEHFRRLAHPYFNTCVRVDITALLQRLAAEPMPGLTPWLAYHHAALGAANSVEAFRYQLEGERVRVHPRIDGSSTVLRSDRSFGFVTLAYRDSLAEFVATAAPALQAARQGSGAAGLGPPGPEDAVMHMTTTPWFAFSSFSHPRAAGGQDSVAKLAFGKFEREAHSERVSMPVALEVHHALMDGWHVGQFYQALQQRLDAACR